MSSKTRTAVIALFVGGLSSFLFLGGLDAQTGAQSGSGEGQQPRDAGVQEAIDVNLVQVPILAYDRNGNPVTDLRPEEIRIKDRGEDQEIAFLEPFWTPPEEGRELPDVKLRVELPGSDEDVSTTQEVEPRRIIFYVDVENDQPLGKTRAAAELVRYVREDLDPSYRAAVLSFNGKVNIEIPFTNNRFAVADALRKAFDQPPRPNITLEARIRELISNLEDCMVEDRSFSAIGNESCMENVAINYNDEVRPRAEDFLIGLEALVRFASGLEGRKSIVAISHGAVSNPWREIREAMKAVFGDTGQLAQTQLMIMTGEGVRAQMDELMDLAVRNEVTLHFVDRTLAPSGDTGAKLGTPYAQGARPMATAFQSPQEDLKEIAAHTGGTFVASLDVYEGVKQVMDIEKAGYYVGYYTDSYLPRDQLAKVKIETTRRGVRISHRRGTYARSQRPGTVSIVRGRIGLARPEEVAPGRLRIPFQISADPRDIGYEKVQDSAVTNFTFHVRVEDGDGRLITDSYHFVNHSYPWELWQNQEVEPLLIGGWVEVPLGQYRLAASFKNPKRPELGGELSRPINVASRAAESGASKSGGKPSEGE